METSVLKLTLKWKLSVGVLLPSRWTGNGETRFKHISKKTFFSSTIYQGYGNQKGQLWLQLVREGQVMFSQLDDLRQGEKI